MTRACDSCLAWKHHRLSGVWSGFSEDIVRYLNKSPENRAAGDNLKSRLGAFLTPQILCLLLYRVAHFLWVSGWTRSAALISYANCYVHKVNIPAQSCIGPGCFLPHPAGVTFWGKAGRDITLYSLATCCPREHCLTNLDEAPVLGDRVLVGAHAVVLGAVQVGNDTKIAYGVSLRHDAPSQVLVVSNALKVSLRPRLIEAAGVRGAVPDSLLPAHRSL
jgi:serine O-acetyltransferase